jgi:hypothetical protein
LTGVTVTTGARWVVSAVVSFFEESTTQAESRSGRRKARGERRKSGRRQAEGERRELLGREERISIGVVAKANVEYCALKS